MSSNAISFTDLVASLTEHSQVLSAAAGMENFGTAVESDIPVREMLQRAGELVRGAAALGEQKNPRALGVLSRAMLENLILLLWVQVHEENAAKLNQEALSELARVARVNFEKGKARVMNRETGKDATPELLQSDRFKGLKKPPSIETRAKEAGVEDLYTVFYRFMSLELHGRGLTPKRPSRPRIRRGQ